MIITEEKQKLFDDIMKIPFDDKHKKLLREIQECLFEVGKESNVQAVNAHKKDVFTKMFETFLNGDDVIQIDHSFVLMLVTYVAKENGIQCDDVDCCLLEELESGSKFYAYVNEYNELKVLDSFDMYRLEDLRIWSLYDYLQERF